MKTQLDLRPVFLVTDHGETQSKFWCGFCKEFHYHGRIKDGEFDTRVAHCHHKDSPLRESDYYITKQPHAVNSAMLRLWQEILDLKAKRDEARREVCRHRAACIQGKRAEEIADALGWDCFKENE